MKKNKLNVAMGIVSFIMLMVFTLQYKEVMLRQEQITGGAQNQEIQDEVNKLQEKKDEYAESIAQLEGKIQEYENIIANNDEISKAVLRELDNARALLGLVDVIGEGVILEITPKSNILTEEYNIQPIEDSHLVLIINELYAAGAEAISINDIRITSTTGIRNAGNAIQIGDSRISFNESVEIKAIGEKDLLEAALSFPGNIPVMLWDTCDIKWRTTNEVEINRGYNAIINPEYMEKKTEE